MKIEYKIMTDPQRILLQSLGQTIENNGVSKSSVIAVSSILNIGSETGARLLRDSLLAASDWTQVADAPVDQAAWSTYRQALRDIPDQAGFPDNVTWPEAP